MKQVIEAFTILLFIPYYLSARALRVLRRDWQPRYWSNQELRRLGFLFQGDVINVSGWTDSDKQGGKYHDYFPNCERYVVSNWGQGMKGKLNQTDEILLDLTQPLAETLKQQFDVVFNHTTLEHVYPIQLAFHNLCQLSRDIVILVVPFAQHTHWVEGSFGDYWRLTPFTFQELFRENGFTMIYWATNENPVYAQYLLVVAAKDAKKWQDRLPPMMPLTQQNTPGHTWVKIQLP